MPSLLTNLSNLLVRAKEQLKPVVANVERLLSPVTQFTRSNPLTAGLTLGIPAGLGVASVIGGIKKRRAKKSKTRKVKRKSSSKRRKKRKTTCPSRRKKRRNIPRTSNKKIKFTKNGQPYVILKSGKARFIKRSSAKLAKKRKGGFR